MELRLTVVGRARHLAARWLRRWGWERPGMKPYKYQALVTLYPPEDGGLDADPPLHVRHLTVRARFRGTSHSGIFGALVSAEDGSLLSPGSHDVIATMEVLGDDVPDYLAPGVQFELLSGSEVGHGVVTRRIFI